MSEPLHHEIQARAQRVAALCRPKVICLDDDPVTQKVYRLVLEDEVDLLSVYDAGQAFALLGEREADLLVTDSIGLPYVDRFRREHPEVPLVVLSGHRPPRHLPPGVLAWAQKPVEPEALAQLVAHYARGLFD